MHAKKSSKRASTKKIKSEKKKGVLFFNLFIAVVVAICFIGMFNNYSKISQRNERLEELSREYNSLRIKNDEIRNRLEINRARVFDEDYIVNFARAHGLRRDSEILFYLHPEQ